MQFSCNIYKWKEKKNPHKSSSTFNLRVLYIHKVINEKKPETRSSYFEVGRFSCVWWPTRTKSQTINKAHSLLSQKINKLNIYIPTALRNKKILLRNVKKSCHSKVHCMIHTGPLVVLHFCISNLNDNNKMWKGRERGVKWSLRYQ